MDRTRKRIGPGLGDLRRAAASVGATIEDQCGYRFATFQVAAPAGKVWSCTGDIHWIVLTWNGTASRPTWPAEKRDAIADAIERISYGLADCEDLDCGVCHPES